MVRYVYAWTPLVIVEAVVVVLALPWFGLIAVTLAALAALAALASALLFVPYTLVRTISGHWHNRTSARPHATATLAPAMPQDA